MKRVKIPILLSLQIVKLLQQLKMLAHKLIKPFRALKADQRGIPRNQSILIIIVMMKKMNI